MLRQLRTGEIIDESINKVVGDSVDALTQNDLDEIAKTLEAPSVVDRAVAPFRSPAMLREAVGVAKGVGEAVPRAAARYGLPIVAGEAALASLPAWAAAGGGLAGTGLRIGAEGVGSAIGGTAGRVASERRLPTWQDPVIEGVQGVGAQGVVEGLRRYVFTPAASAMALRAIRGIKHTLFPGPVATEDQARRYMQRVGADVMGVTGETLHGFMVQDAIPGAINTTQRTVRRNYGAVTHLGRNLPKEQVPNDLIKTAKAMQESLNLVGDTERIAPIKGALAGILNNIIERGEGKIVTSKIRDAEGNVITRRIPPEPISFKEYMGWESELREVLPTDFLRRMTPKTPSEGVLKNLVGGIRRRIDGLATNDPRVVDALRTAREDFQLRHLPVQGVLMEASAGKIGPTALIDSFTTTKGVDKLRDLFRGLDPQSQASIRHAWFSEKVEKYVDINTGVFDAANYLKEWNALGRPVQQILSGNQSAAVDNVFRQLATVVRQNKLYLREQNVTYGGTFGLLAYGAMSSLWRGDFVGASKYMLVGAGAAELLPRVLGSEGAIRFFDRGLREPPGTQRAIRMGQQFITHIGLDKLVGTGGEPAPEATPGPSAPAPMPAPTMQPTSQPSPVPQPSPL